MTPGSRSMRPADSEARAEWDACERLIATLQAAFGAEIDIFDQRALLIRQRDIFEQFFGEVFTYNYNLIIDGKIGIVAPMSCLESLAFDIQNRQFPLSEISSEMETMVLSREISGTEVLRVYVHTVATPFVPKSPELVAMIERDVADGWQLAAHLHNHPFLFNNSSGDIAGIVAPSEGDVLSHIELRDELALGEAWITNGIHTLRVEADELEKLRFPR